ncbi:MAG: glycosyltransferase [Actinomycetota bacterium]|nr:glycosyltransferase [Actinomycetota bacterium]
MSHSIAGHLGVLSLERWDLVWRRNQHLASQLLEQGIVERITFVEPADWAPGAIGHPEPGITTIRPALKIPKRAGGLRLLGSTLQRGPLRDVDLMWINDAPLGRWVARSGQPALYDVTDDWRSSLLDDRIRRRLIAAEEWLSTRARTVVCSDELASRWKQRYGTNPAVVRNGVDLANWRDVVPVTLTGAGPHVGYVGTLHAERLDVDLVLELAQSSALGTVHLVGPDVLDPASRSRLDAAGVRRVGVVAHTEVPAWMRAFDVLICPHLVTAFTLSLDAIKAYEYAAAGRPVVATPTSGFQALAVDGWVPTDRSGFVDGVIAALHDASKPQRLPSSVGWDERARQFGEVLRTTSSSRARG